MTPHQWEERILTYGDNWLKVYKCERCGALSGIKIQRGQSLLAASEVYKNQVSLDSDCDLIIIRKIQES